MAPTGAPKCIACASWQRMIYVRTVDIAQQVCRRTDLDGLGRDEGRLSSELREDRVLLISVLHQVAHSLCCRPINCQQRSMVVTTGSKHICLWQQKKQHENSRTCSDVGRTEIDEGGSHQAREMEPHPARPDTYFRKPAERI
eukprot:2591032-Rhodomonas_salina.1